MQRTDEFPSDFSVRDFKPGNAWRRAAVGPGHAAGIEKQNATAPFVARDVRVPVQENIDIIRRSIRRNVLQAEFQPTSRKVENQRPLEIAVAISAHNDHGAVQSPAVRQESFPRKHRQDARSHQRLWPSPSRSPADDCACPREQRYARPLSIVSPCLYQKFEAPLLKTKGRHADEALEAVVNAEFDVTMPIRPLDLVNNVTQKPWPCAWHSFAAPMAN